MRITKTRNAYSVAISGIQYVAWKYPGIGTTRVISVGGHIIELNKALYPFKQLRKLLPYFGFAGAFCCDSHNTSWHPFWALNAYTLKKIQAGLRNAGDGPTSYSFCGPITWLKAKRKY